MSKKEKKNNNTIKSSSNKNDSRVKKNEYLYNEEDLSLTKQQKFNFDSNDLEDEMDTSFLDKKKKIKATTKVNKVVIEKKVYPKFLISILLILLISSSVFNILYFLTFDHHKVKKVVEKKSEERIVFVGDSITYRYDLLKYYSSIDFINSGIDGNTTQSILNDINNRIYRYKPAKVFLLIGTNDKVVSNIPIDETISNIKTIVENIRKNIPKCEIYLESVYPINNTNHEKISKKDLEGRSNDSIIKINQELKKYCEEKSIKYIDMYSCLIDDQNNLNIEYTLDGLHLSDEGYKVVTKELKKYI